MAKCFGLAPSTQSKSGKQRVVMVSRTPRTCLPAGEAAAALEEIMAKELLKERRGAGLSGGKGYGGAGGDSKRRSNRGR